MVDSLSSCSPRKGGYGVRLFLSRELFLYVLDLEVERARRYQDFFCVLKLKLFPLPGQEEGKGLQKCHRSLTNWLREELRESDLLGSLGDDHLAVLLPYADLSVSRQVKSRLEDSLKYFGFQNDGYEVMIDQICFPKDAAVTKDLVSKVTGIEDEKKQKEN